jgi:hypothetical protein
MRSSTRKAKWGRSSLLLLAVNVAACSTAARSNTVVEDHSTDASERIRAGVFVSADHSRDAVERLKAGAFSD